MPRIKTIQRFEEWKLSAENVDAFFRLMEGEANRKPLRFRDACVVMKVPYTLMHAHMKGSPELKARYDAVKAANADLAAHRVVEIVDSLDKTSSMVKVAAARTQIDGLLKVASKWDRDDYGERIAVEKTVTITDATALIGRARDLLALAKVGRLPAPGLVIEPDTVTVEAVEVDKP